jgi:hypothetical protein
MRLDLGHRVEDALHLFAAGADGLHVGAHLDERLRLSDRELRSQELLEAAHRFFDAET